MSSLPTGTVTFLFTDIEASTRLLQDLGDARSQQVFVNYRRLLWDAVESAGGRLYQDQGESFLFVFQGAKGAVLAAVAAQRAVAAHIWPGGATLRVRMGLHTGEPVTTAEGYLGLDVHIVVRICQAGHGGQILVSQTTRELVAEDLPDGVTLRDLGEHRLKDLASRERLFQVVVPELPSDFPPLKSFDLLPNNLPVPLTSFVGREQEIQEVQQLLSTARLLTLTGAGGCGKSRLALRVAGELVDAFLDGVWLVELAPLTGPGLVAQAVASVLRVREQPGRPFPAVLADSLRAKHLLLVLDNCEHLLTACAHLADALLRVCPDLRILATSRQALGINGETAWRVPSLSFPDSRRGASPERLGEYEAVRLFVDRAKAVVPDFVLSPSNAPVVAQICRRLDGLPLAIELAAARTRVLSVEEIALRLDDRFQLLTGGSRTALPQHRTLRAALDWSHDLLTEQERALLRRLAVFAGGFTLDTAEIVCARGGLGRGEMLDLLEQLVDKSLVIVDRPDGALRYRMLETVRLYGWGRLLEYGEISEFRAKHLNLFLALAEEAEPHLRALDQTEWLDSLEAEHDNFRAALGWSQQEAGAEEEHLRLAGALWRFWGVRGYFSEGREWLESALARNADVSAAARAKALHAAGYLAYRLDELAHATTRMEDALGLYRELQDASGLAFCLTSLGAVAREQGRYDQAVAFLEEGLGLAREVGDTWTLARALSTLGVLKEFQGDYVHAAALFEESLAVCRVVGDQFGIAYALEHLGAVTTARGEYARARVLLEEALSFFQELGDRAHIAYTFYELGSTARLEGDYRRAEELLEQSLVLARDLRDRFRVARCLEGLAGVAIGTGRPERAAQLCAAADALRVVTGEPLSPSARVDRDRITETIRAVLGDTGFAAAWTRGQAMTLEQAASYALSGQP